MSLKFGFHFKFSVISVSFIAWTQTSWPLVEESLREDTAASGGRYKEHQNRGIWGRVPNVPTLLTSQAAAAGGGVASFCCSGEIWHGAERGGGREWDSPIGINGSSEVWTERRNSQTWGWGAMTENSAVRAWRLFSISCCSGPETRPRRADSWLIWQRAQ